ncbi:pentapeptide repeat-containing protein [Pseudoalteromonas sp. NZS100_1]|uniref:pentapeptide repeat-containing protein n=1 Tax=Pseudoalteromonas sp. NZS100_1 TaxID=2792073 RepID=UPI0018CE57F3|nr:pentapeptide repeat-containing protein [Pseudoalteromonas sp. NZS100_1]
MTLKDSNRVKFTDKKFDTTISEGKFINTLFERLVALKITFKNVDFRYCIFDSAYLRNCSFESCDFTGSKKQINKTPTLNFALFEVRG